MASPLLMENVWLQQQIFEDAEKVYHQVQIDPKPKVQKVSASLAGELAQVRKDIQNALNKPPVKAVSALNGDDAVLKRLEALEKENKELRKITDDLRALILTVQSAAGQETVISAGSTQPKTVSQPARPSPKAPVPVQDDDDDDDDENLFGSDDEETKALKEKRVKEYAEKKSKKPALIAKSSVLLDVKPWDDETDMAEMEKCVRSIELDGLVWGASKLAEVGYGIKKLVIMLVVEDDKVSIEDLSERIQGEFDSLVQSVDVAAFNKI